MARLPRLEVPRQGGLPHNAKGWLITTCFRLRAGDPLTTDVYHRAIGLPDDRPALGNLPHRNGPRPAIAPWPVPHRQTDQFPGTGMRQKLNDLFDATVDAHAETVQYKLSFYETHNPAVTLLDPDEGHAHARLGEGEVAHIHPDDGSMHMIFSPSDAKTVIEEGWGERHPMAGVLPNLPDTYLFVYPPRDEAELAVVKELLHASIAHMSARPGPCA